MAGGAGAAGADGLTARDVCDVVYAIAVQQIERRVESARLTAGLIVALGGEAAEPSLAEAQAAFDEWLVSDPAEGTAAPVDEWRQVMGLGAA